MTTREVIAAVVRELTDELVICTTGFISRDTCAVKDRPGQFYMIGSMGLAPSIGLGLAVARPRRRVVVFDGDGALLMALGTLAMVADLQPENFYHLVFDNEAYASTGCQRTLSGRIALDAMAAAAGYRHVTRVPGADDPAAAYRALLREPGPGFLLVKCTADGKAPSLRIPHEPPEITRRVAAAAAA